MACAAPVRPPRGPFRPRSVPCGDAIQGRCWLSPQWGTSERIEGDGRGECSACVLRLTRAARSVGGEGEKGAKRTCLLVVLPVIHRSNSILRTVSRCLPRKNSTLTRLSSSHGGRMGGSAARAALAYPALTSAGRSGPVQRQPLLGSRLHRLRLCCDSPASSGALATVGRAAACSR